MTKHIFFSALFAGALLFATMPASAFEIPSIKTKVEAKAQGQIENVRFQKERCGTGGGKKPKTPKPVVDPDTSGNGP